MGTQEQRQSLPAMAFYHQDGLTPAWQQAMKFAGQGGRLATMPDIVAARLATKPGDAPWESYYTTLTAEYYGFGKSGKLLLIIAHGIGPMSSLDGIRKAYAWQYKDKTRKRHGGRITQREFWDLEAGKYGEVAIIDYEEYCKRYEYPFLEILRTSQALSDPVLAARLGPEAERYILAHDKYARAWHGEQAGITPDNKYGTAESDFQNFVARRKNLHEGVVKGILDPYIIHLEDAANCCYGFGPGHGHREIEKGYAIAHLVSTGGLCHLHHERNESLVLDVGCHEWSNGVRFVAIPDGASTGSGIHRGPDIDRLFKKHWQDLLVPVFPPDIEVVGFRTLMKIGDQWFTQYPKAGERMDNWEPEHVVTSIEKVGEPVLFRTTIGGYYGFFKYGMNEVQAIAPPEANGYSFVSEPQIESHDGDPTHHTAMVQFFKVAADPTKRLMRADQLAHDYERIMKLTLKEED